jgi:hypothetical protein
MILHAKQRWPEAIDAQLWPYAIRMALQVAPGAALYDIAISIT